MFKTMILIAGAWVDATPGIPRSKARRIAQWYKTHSEWVQNAKVVRF